MKPIRSKIRKKVKPEFVVMIITLIFILLIVLPALILPMKYHKQPKTGEVWYRVYGDIDNPFEKPDTIFYNIIDVNNGYILYSKQNDPDYKFSMKRYLFVTGTDLYKKK